MIMAVGLNILKIDRGERSEWSGHDAVDYNLLNIQFIALYLVRLWV